MKKIWNFLKDEDGLEMTEYAVMGALILVVGGAAAVTMGERISDVFDALVEMLTSDEAA